MRFDAELDVRGLHCPLPILRTKKKLAQLDSGQVLKIEVTDPGALKDFRLFAKHTGHQLLSHKDAGRKLTFYFQKK